MNDLTDRLQFVRELAEQGDIRELQRAAQRGRLVRVHRGAYYPFERWEQLTQTERYTFRMLGCVGASRIPPTISHVSAAVLHGAPIIGPMPTLVHMLATAAAGTRTEHGYRKHATAFAGTDDIRRGRRRAERAISFADARSGSPGETLSRVRIWEAGLPAPELQVAFNDKQGRIGIVDFWWPDYQLIGEFDGVSKYVRDEFTGGRDTATVVVAEKVREDRLRALGHAVARWGWSVAWPPLMLQGQLRGRGLPVNRRRPA